MKKKKEGTKDWAQTKKSNNFLKSFSLSFKLFTLSWIFCKKISIYIDSNVKFYLPNFKSASAGNCQKVHDFANWEYLNKFLFDNILQVSPSVENNLPSDSNISKKILFLVSKIWKILDIYKNVFLLIINK